MCIKIKAEMAAFLRSRFVFICLMCRHFVRNKDVECISLNRGKLKTRDSNKNTYPVKMKL